MKIRLPPALQRRLKGELVLAKYREVGGLLMAEHLSDDDYRIVDLSVQRTGGSAVCFIRDPKKHRAQLDRFFARTGRNYTRFNYLGEWHSHPWAPVSPSSRDSRTMQALVRDPEVGANVLVLVIVRLAAGGTLESSATVFRAGDMARRADLTLESTDNTDLSVDVKNALRLATQPEQDDPLDSKARYVQATKKGE
jgi:integrative and conjugative element protein (TIGR02256 family)